MESKLVLFLTAAVTVVAAAPAKLEDLRRQSFGADSFSRRTLGGQNESPKLRGAYSFNFETPEGIKRQEEGKPQAPTGAVAQNGEWSLTYPNGAEGSFKFVADQRGFRLLESDVITETPPRIIRARLEATKAKLEAAKAKAHQRAQSRRRLTFAKP